MIQSLGSVGAGAGVGAGQGGVGQTSSRAERWPESAALISSFITSERKRATIEASACSADRLL